MEQKKTPQKTVDEIIRIAFRELFEERKKNGVVQRFEHGPEAQNAFAEELMGIIEKKGLAGDYERALLRKKIDQALAKDTK